MNRIYRLVWSELTRAWVAVAEIARGRGKRSSATVGTLAASLALIGAPAHALDAGILPTGGRVVAGSAGISQAANVLTVQQSTQCAALDWQSFNIGSAATVNFTQPSSSAVALNRIVGNSASEIYGKLNANGQVFFSNPNGMLFARGAQVNVGGILATTLSLSNEDFMAGNTRFTNPGSGSIRNEGLINALGSVALIGNTVQNAGQIIATTVTLAAGNTVAVDLTGDGLIRARVEDAALTASIENSGSIDAALAVTLTAGQAQNTLDRVVNNSGVIRATGLTMKGGEILLEAAVVENTGSIVASGKQGGGTIKLMGDMGGGKVKVGGMLDASAPVAGDGGFIETSAASVVLDPGHRVTTFASMGKTGTWLIDPNDYTIAASGGNITGAQLSSDLSSTSITISTATQGTAGGNGDIFVNDAVSWSTNTLTLNAERNIGINATLNGSGTAGLALQYGQGAVAAGNAASYSVNAPVNLASTGSFSTKLGSDGAVTNYTIITSLGAAGSTTATDLQGMKGNLVGKYVLGADIDATSTSGWNWDGSSVYNGFDPVGSSASSFTGGFDGLGHTISGLTINRPTAATAGGVALFGHTNGTGFIRNVGLLNVSITGTSAIGYAAALVGLNGSAISNAYSTGSVSGANGVGGLVGTNYSAVIQDSYSSATVSGTNATSGVAGGLVGVNNDGGFLVNTHATGNITGSAYFSGGLVGSHSSNSSGLVTLILNSYSTGNVTSSGSYIGGLVGGASGVGNISNSYATGTVSGLSGGQYVGGLVGLLGSQISNAYATGNVSNAATGSVGGLVGYINAPGGVRNSFATGNATGGATTTTVGGLAGNNLGTISGSFSTGYIAGLSHLGGFVGKSFGTILGSYWDTQTSGKTIPDVSNSVSGVTGLTTAQMKAQASYTGWDFTNTWSIAEGSSYPVLRPAVINQWTGATSNLWGTNGNWSLGHAPLANETVIIPDLGTTVDVASATANAGFLYAREAVTASNGAGTLVVADQAGFNTSLTVVGGTISLNGSSNVYSLDLSSGTLNGTGALTVSSSFSRTSGSLGSTFTGLSLTQASGNLTPGNLAVNGALSLTATTGILDATGTLVATGVATLTADKMNLAGSLTAASINLQNKTAANAIKIGSTVDTTTSTLELSQAELNTISTTGLLTIGATNNSGALTVSQATSFATTTSLTNSTGSIAINGAVTAGTGNLTLKTTGAITQTGTITTTGLLTTSSGAGTTLSAANSVGSFTATNSSSGDIVFTQGGAIDLAVISNTAVMGGVTINATGAITQSGTINAGGFLTTTSSGGTTLNLANTVGGFNATNAGAASTISLTNTATNLFINGLSQTATGAVTIKNSGSVTVTGVSDIASSLSMQYGQGTVAAGNAASFTAYAPVNLPAGNTFSTTLGSNGTPVNYVVITDLGSVGSTTGTDLQGMNGNRSGKYALGANIDAAATAGWNSGAGFMPVGYSADVQFTGGFEGLGHTISNLTINRPENYKYVGLFGITSSAGGLISNIGLVNASIIGNTGGTGISGSPMTGALVGYNRFTISNAYSSGSISGKDSVGGLIGAHDTAAVSNSYSTADVTSTTYAGGLVGVTGGGGTLTNVHATGDVTVTGSTGALAGGLVAFHGMTPAGLISNAYATGNVTGNGDYLGGLAGQSNTSCNISNSYATGNVTGTRTSGGQYVGGLLGRLGGQVDNSYALGNVSVSTSTSAAAGGLVGRALTGSTINTSYSTGGAVGAQYSGGIVGSNNGTMTNAYWNTTTSGLAAAVGGGAATGGTGLTAAQMQTAANFAGFIFTATAGAAGNNWVIVDADGTLNNNAGAAGATLPMLASEYSTTLFNAHQLQLMRLGVTASYTMTSNIDAAKTATGTDVWDSGGFVPVGNVAARFSGSLDGLNHVVDNLTINRPTLTQVALLAYVQNSGFLRNIGLTNVSITGDMVNSVAGALAGSNSGRPITNAYSTGTVAGGTAGGLVGQNGGVISNSHSTANVSGNNSDGGGAGGLAGYTGPGGILTNVYATGNVTGSASMTGGLVGQVTDNNNGVNAWIINAYATGNVTSSGSYVGGLVGYSAGTFGKVGNVYATGNVTGTNTSSIQWVGGLIGRQQTLVENAYATGNVSVAYSASYAGGLMGCNMTTAGVVNNSFSTGAVSGPNAANLGGLVSVNSSGAIVSSSYWDVDTSGLATSAAGTAVHSSTATINAYNQATYAGFDFANTWWMSETNTRPFLRMESTTTITNAHQLQLMGMNAATLAAKYTLGTNISMAELTRSAGMWDTGKGFVPVGSNVATFNGAFEGLGHTITGLTINRPATNVGLFNTLGGGATVSNVGLIGGAVTGSYLVGALAGQNSGTVINSYVTLPVTATTAIVNSLGQNDSSVGGLVGANSGTIANSYATGTVTGIGVVGGLVGRNNYRVEGSYATGNVYASHATWAVAGGLVGANWYTAGTETIINSFATGNVTGFTNVGGLVGWNGGTVSTAYASGNVAHTSSGGEHSGGLIGYQRFQPLTNVYATGDVTIPGASIVGGLIGYSEGGSLTNAYATGAVTAGTNVGGLIGYRQYTTLSNSYWDITTSGQGTSAGGAGLATAQMQQLASFTGWSIANTGGSNATWRIYEGRTAPLLRSFLTPLTLTGATDTTVTYNGAAQTAGATSLTVNGTTIQGTAATGTNAGFYNGYWSTQQGYDLIGGNLTIDPATLSIISLSGTRVYDGTDIANASIFNLGGLVGGQTLTLTGAGTVADKNVGTNKAVALGTLALGDGTGLASNYTFTGGTHVATISQRPITVTADAKTKTYGDIDPVLTYAIGTAAAGTGLVNGDTLGGSLTRVAGENVITGPYAITQGSLVANSNYSLSYNGSNLAITPRPLTASVAAPSKTYDGNTTSAPTLTITAGFVGSETVGAGGTASFNSKDVATANLVTVSSTSLADGNGGGLASNYSLAAGETVAANILAKALTATVAAPSKTYDGNTSATPTLTVTAGLVGSETVTATGAATFNTKDVLTANLVTVNSTVLADGANGGMASNYSLPAGETVASSITPKALVATVAAPNKTYDGTTTATPTLTIINGLVGGETVTVSGTATFNTQHVLTANLVTVSSTALTDGTNGGLASNYSLAPGETVAASITPAPLTATLTNTGVTKTYDGTLAAPAGFVPTYNVTGLVAGDTVAAINSSGSSYNTANVASATTVTASGLAVAGITGSNASAASDYNLNTSAGVAAMITAAPLTVSASIGGTTTKTYDGTTTATGATVSGSIGGGVVGDTLTLNTGGITLNYDSIHVVSATRIGATGSAGLNIAGSSAGSVASDYSFTPPTITNIAGTITARPLAVTANVHSKTYGDADPVLTYAIGATAAGTGLVNGDGLAGALTRVAGESVAAGPYAITQGSVAAGSNYTLAYTGNNLAVTPATLTLAADNQTRLYGDANPTLTYTPSGFKLSDTASVIATAPTLTTTAAATSNVGNVPIIVTGGDAGTNYTLGYADGSIAITPAPLTVTAASTTRLYGDANPSLTGSIAGFKNGETASVFTASPTYGTSATTSSNVGAYSIVGAGGTAQNYSFSYLDGSLAVTPATLTLTADNQSRTYGDANPTLTGTIAGFKNSETASVFTTQPSYGTSATTSSNVGAYSIVGAGATATNYSFSYVDGSLAITPATLTLTADSQSRLYGDANPALTYTPSGFKLSDTASVITSAPTLATVAAATSNVGSVPITVSGGDAGSNYTLAYTDGSLAISARPLTVTANAHTKTYGDADPTLSYAIGATAAGTGLVNGDTLGGSLARIAGETVAGGPYAIEQGSLAASSNYMLSYTGANLAITPATLTVTAADASRLYGDANPVLTGSIAGFKNSETASVLTAAPSYGTTATTSSNVGAYSIVGVGGTAQNYSFSYVDGTLAITPATLTVTAASTTRLYGDANPTLTGSITGFKNTETISVLTALPTYSTPATLASNVGSYAIVGAGATATNYSFNYVNGSLAITPAPLTVTAASASRTYGDANPTLTGSIAGFKNSETASVLTAQPSYGTTATTSSNVGTYSIVGAGATATNYSFSYVNGSLAITPATLTLTADSQTRTYGDANPTLTYTPSGFKLTDTASVIATAPMLATTAVATSNVGTVPITVSGGNAGSNYTLAYTDGSFAINPATLTVTAASTTRTYGDANPTLTGSITGFKNSETASVLSAQPSYGTTATTSSNVGTYSIVGAGATAQNYSFGYVDGSLAITPAPLTVTVADGTRTYGDANPTLTGSITGFKNTETISVLTASPTYSTPATLASNVGSYQIVGAGATAQNYSFSYVDGSLAITPAPLIVTADSTTRLYGDANPTLTGSIAGFKNSETASVLTAVPSYGTTATTSSNVGTYAIVGAGGTATNYSFSYVDGSLAITPAPLTVTAADASRIYGDANPVLTGSIAGFKNSETASVLTAQPSYGTTATLASNVGNYAIVGAGATAQNYSFSYIDGALAITPAPVTTVTVPPPDISTTVAETVAVVIQQAIQPTIQSVPLTAVDPPVVSTPAATAAEPPAVSTELVAASPAGEGGVSLAAAASSPPVSDATEKKEEPQPAVKPTIQTVTVANTTVQKPAEQVMQVEQPKGRVLVCRG